MVFFIHLCTTKQLNGTLETVEQMLRQKGAAISLFFFRDVTHLLTDMMFKEKEEHFQLTEKLPIYTRAMLMITRSQFKNDTQHVSGSNCIEQARKLGIKIVTIAELYSNMCGEMKEETNTMDNYPVTNNAFVKQWLEMIE